jgi:outer membrane protein OmpA-like peptidoglycan-associated protein
MNQRPKRSEQLNSRGLRTIALVLVLASVLAACSSVPDWANPSRLYDSVTGIFTGGEGYGAFPTAIAVPDRPETTTAAARQKTAQGLVADRENAQYTDDEIRRDETVQVAAIAPAPRPAPAQQLAQAPARPSLLESRRVAPRGTAATAAAGDTLESRRTITSGRATTAAPARVAPRVVGRRAQAPTVVPTAPVAVARAPARVVPAPAAAPVVVQAPRPRLVLPAQPIVAVAPGQTVVSQTFARLLQDSASTVSTAPANASFSLPSAAPIQAGESSVSPIVRDTYNAALVATSRSITRTASAQPVAFQGQAASGSAAVTVQFGHDSAGLPRAGGATVRQVAEQYKARGGVIRVVGHASSETKNMPVVEHNLANFKVSLDRAQTVANELIRLGVPPDAIFVEARGASDPAFFESMPAGAAGNRRVEIFLDFFTS